MELSDKDRLLLQEKGISKDTLILQLSQIKEGFPYLKIDAPATPGHGITIITENIARQSTAIWDDYLKSNPKVVKLVPASGAASRMFKSLFSFLDSKKDKPTDDFMKDFFNNIDGFAFLPELNKASVATFGKSVENLIKENRYKDVVRILLDSQGLNYGKLPKALLEFHRSNGGARTALEEHLAEGAQYAASKNGDVNIHFTVSEQHIPLVKQKLEQTKAFLQHLYGVNFNIELSVQKPSTDTIAATADSKPFRKEGKLVFRPGGHGALIENLNDIDADVVFIKNIDNVVPDSKRDTTITYKKILGGLLVGIKSKINSYCNQIIKETPSKEKLEEMVGFLRTVLCITHDETDKMNDDEIASYVFAKLNRPLRVAGMVKNEGEPGGGPFLCFNPDGTISPQILESSQIDPDNKDYQKMLKDSTHFNPVDIVCSTKDFLGRKFYLPDYVDVSTGFISSKSVEGVEIKALELPGLWNGAMSDWNTIFVEVPAETFNPVKTVNDLLRPSHQA